MPYIQLSQLSLPSTASRTTVFPFLVEDAPASGPVTYRIGLLVSEANHMARTVLEAVGFIRDGTQTTLPGGTAGDLWAFYQSKPADTGDSKGPFLILSDAAAPAPRARRTYVVWGNLTAVAGVTADIRQPDTITVNAKSLKVEGINDDAGVQLEEVAFDGRPSLQFAANDNTVDQTAVSFRLPIKGTVPLERAGGQPLSFTFTLDLEPLTDGATWAGSTLKVNGSTIVDGGASSRLPLGRDALVTSGGAVSYEFSPGARWTIPLGSGGLFQATFAVQTLRLRFTDDSIDVYLVRSAPGARTRLRVDLEFPLIMARLPGAAAEALALVIPLIDPGGDQPPALRWRIAFDVGTEWDADADSILSWSSDIWKFAPTFFSHDWPIRFDDRSEGMALGGLQFCLAELLGDALGPVTFALLPNAASPFAAALKDGAIQVPLHLSTTIANQRLALDLILVVSLSDLRLKINRLGFTFPVSAHGEPVQLIDLFAFAIMLPMRNAPAGKDAAGNFIVDGYFDFEAREFVLVHDPGVSEPWLIVPGGLSNSDGEVDEDSEHEPGLVTAFRNRLVFKLDSEFSPDEYPNRATDPDKKTYLRINKSGISLHALVDTTHVPTVFSGDDLSPPVTIRAEAERKGKKSHVVLIDNVIREASVFGKMYVPGTDDLVASIEVGFRQKERGEAPVVYASVDLDATDGEPVAQLTAGYLQLAIDNFHDWTLTWDTERNDWDLRLPTDLRLSVAPRTGEAGGLEQLRQPNAIKARGLDLMNLHRGVGSIELNLDRDVEFDCLDGMFGVRLKQLSFGWGTSFVLGCETAEFTFKNPGAFEVTVEVGGVLLEFSGGSRLKMRNPSRIGIDVAIGDSVRFRGAVAWVDNDRERYFAAAGTLSIEGLPEASTLLKLGTGVKENGQIVPNIVLYGAMDFEVTLFSGVVAKSFGAGIGVNNRLKGIGERPTAETILANIDQLEPSRIDGWEFVSRNGFFLSIVGTTILGSTEGGNSSQNAYVAALLLSIDLDLNVVAAGKMWLYSSVDYVRRRENWTRPALVGAITLTPRERLITAAIESKPNPAIESNDRIAQILNKGHVKLSFVLCPKLVDFFLEDVSYRDQFLGVEMMYRGSLRFAIFEGVVLLRATQMVTGQFDRTFEEGPGGFSAAGDVAVLVEFGGLVSQRGLAAYGLIAISISLRVRAWIQIEFSFTIGCGRWKKRISFSKTFRLPPGRIELGLRGALAFDESGQFGFDGQMSISVAICGYRLSLAPSLRFNEGLIAQVRGRVAAFERRIEAYRQQLLTGSTRVSALVASSQPWRLYESGGLMFLTPPPESVGEWLTPTIARMETRNGQPAPVFENHVKRIRIHITDGAGTRLLREVYTPWDTAHTSTDPLSDTNNLVVLRRLNPTLSDSLTDSLEEVETIMSETAEQPAGAGVTALTPGSEFRPVSDPRYASVGREYWTDEDRIRLPDYALPIRLRSVDDQLSSASGTNPPEADYLKLVDFLYWRTRAARIQRHRAGDRDDAEQINHNRGSINQLLLDQLGAAASAASAWTGGPINAATAPEWFGVVFPLPGGVDVRTQFRQLSFEVVRVAADGTPTTDTIDVTMPTDTDAFDSVRSRIHLLPPRQQFDVLQAGVDGSTTNELARVSVKLPIALDDEFFEGYDLVVGSDTIRVIPQATVSHFRVHRRFPWQQDPEVVGDQVRPELVYVDEDVRLGQDPVVVVGPFIFSDAFGVRERELSTPGLRAETMEIEYYLEPIAVGDTNPPNYLQNLRKWRRTRVRLHVPPRDVFPTDLGIVLPFGSLVQPPRAGQVFGRFALISAGREGTPLASLPDRDDRTRLMTPEDFEILAEPIPLERSGFYAGAAEAPDALTSNPTEAVLDDLNGTSPASGTRTTDGLFALSIEDAGEPGWFRPSAEATLRLNKPGFGFRLFVRPRIRSAAPPENGAPVAIGPVRSLSMFLCRTAPPVDEIPEPPKPPQHRWHEPPKLRPIRQLEWIARTLVDDFERRASAWTPIAVCERPLDRNVILNRPESSRRHLGFSWPLADAAQGGVEVLVRDLDDTALQARLLCESVAREIYQSRIPDFRNASLWQLSPLEQSSRLRWLGPAGPTPSGPYDVVAQFLLLDPSNPVIRMLNRHAVELARCLTRPTTRWPDLFVAGKNWMTAVYEFRKSAINLNDSPIRETIADIELLLRCVLTGRTDGALGNLNADARKRIADETTAILSEIENRTASQLSLSDETEEARQNARRSLVDLDLAKRLAAIVRGREVVAEELFDSSNELPPFFAGDGSAASWLPRGERFETLRAQAQQQSTGGTLPLTSQLLARFAASGAIRITDAAASTALKNRVDRLIELATFAGADPQRRTAAAGIVSKAAGLTRAFNRLDGIASATQARIERRPHHQLTVRSTNDDTKTGEPVALESLLPDEVKGDGAVPEELEALPAREVMAYWNLLERMGFALDVGAVDSLGTELSQAELLPTLHSAGLEELLGSAGGLDGHVIQMIVGREPDSEHRGRFPDPDDDSFADDYVGHSFVKLAVIPRRFHALLLSSGNLSALREWFELRKVELGPDAARAQALLDRVGRIASYVVHGKPLDSLIRVRVEIRDRRWVSLPAVNGRSQVDWVVPDARGHRFEAVARSVSRYEPVIRWGLNFYRPVEWPDATAAVPTELAVRRLVAEDLGSGAFVADIPENLPVSLYGHPELIRFSYLLPSAGARSLLNVISAVRTGYQGVTTVFRYELRDHDKVEQRIDSGNPVTVRPLGWDNLLGAMALSSGQLDDPAPVAKPAPQQVLVDARLMRNERMLTLRNLPYFYQYRLHARSQYDADFIRPAIATPPEGNQPARREPKILAARPPVITVTGSADNAHVEIELRLTRTGDLLTPAEWSASPPLEPRPVQVNGTSGPVTVPLSADQLPEPAMGYHFYYQVQGQDYYVFVAELLMPWHPAYQLPPGNGPLRPWFRLMDSRASYPTAAHEWPAVTLGQSQHGAAGVLDQPAYLVRLEFDVVKRAGEAELLFSIAAQQKMQVSRAGKLSDLISPE